MKRKVDTFGKKTHPLNSRKDFILKMYEQMWGNINRHVLIPWQSVTVLLAAFAIFTFVEKNIIPFDFAILLIILAACWQVAHVIDSSFWVRHNFWIIVNIERQFLFEEDLEQIHCHFKKHPEQKMLDFFRIQFYLGISIAIGFLLYHLYRRVLLELVILKCNFKITVIFPYIASILFILFLVDLNRRKREESRVLEKKSPGIEISSCSGYN